MSEQVCELESQIVKLELQLANAKSNLARIRERARKPRGALPLVAALMAASIVLSASARVKAPFVITAPFRVVDAARKKLFEVSDATSDHPRGFALFDAAERPLVLGIAQEGVSSFTTFSADKRAEAAMGVSKLGGPAFTLKYDGQPRISMAVTDGEPMLNMTNDKNVIMMMAGQGEYGGGLLLLADAQGTPMVKFSTSSQGAGTVVTYPNGGAGGAIVGLKGSMLCGKGGCGQ